MLVLPLLGGFSLPTTTPPHVQTFVSALHEEFNPVLVPYFYKIAECESTLRQFDSKGDPLMSDTKDFGILQINQVHDEDAAKLGLDFKHSIVDNVKMARFVYEKQGFKAWTCAKKLGILSGPEQAQPQ